MKFTWTQPWWIAVSHNCHLTKGVAITWKWWNLYGSSHGKLQFLMALITATRPQHYIKSTPNTSWLFWYIKKMRSLLCSFLFLWPYLSRRSWILPKDIYWKMSRRKFDEKYNFDLAVESKIDPTMRQGWSRIPSVIGLKSQQ